MGFSLCKLPHYCFVFLRTPMIRSLHFRLVLLIFLALLFQRPEDSAQAQSWPSPELEQMYGHACSYRDRRDYDDAITTFRQGLQLLPGNIAMSEGLGECLYLQAKYEEACHVLEPILSTKNFPEYYFEITILSLNQSGAPKKAVALADAALGHYPLSGPLWHAKGLAFQNLNKTDEATDAWCNGVTKDPNYSDNYAALAEAMRQQKCYMDAALLDEYYLLYTTDTNSTDIHRKLLEDYKKISRNISEPERKKGKQTARLFRDAPTLLRLVRELIPVISDGITTENLLMLRIRLMQAYLAEKKKDCIGLIHFQDNATRAGWSEVYAQWLFGKAEDSLQDVVFYQFHPYSKDSFLKWKKTQALPVITTTDLQR